ncbi:hypothetical protein C8R44DRAFT_724241 [Mycena epipterygia]|nr:hypothetical protein C8R44DRAFT_724241 [Mycena epipterygia]
MLERVGFVAGRGGTSKRREGEGLREGLGGSKLSRLEGARSILIRITPRFFLLWKSEGVDAEMEPPQCLNINRNEPAANSRSGAAGSLHNASTSNKTPASHRSATASVVRLHSLKLAASSRSGAAGSLTMMVPGFLGTGYGCDFVGISALLASFDFDFVCSNFGPWIDFNFRLSGEGFKRTPDNGPKSLMQILTNLGDFGPLGVLQILTKCAKMVVWPGQILTELRRRQRNFRRNGLLGRKFVPEAKS